MEDLNGKVAVITGGGGGIGKAIARRLGIEGVRIVLADVQPDVLDTAVGELRAEGLEALGVTTDVTDRSSLVNLRDEAIAEFGGVHLVFNNAGIGAGAEGLMWNHEDRDWQWALAVNLWGVINGINIFTPLLIDQGEPGHIVNTSSGNGGISPLPGSPQYAVTKAAVVTLTECLYGQLRAEVGDRIGVSVLFPGPHMLKTGLFESWRSRPERYAKARPRQKPYVTADGLAEQMRAAGIEPKFTEPSELADNVLDGIRQDRFWIHPGGENSDRKLQARMNSILDRSNPDYLRDVPG